VLYMLLMGVRNRWQARRTPAAGDSQTTVLRKLDRQDMGVTVPKYEQAGKTAYRVQPLRTGRPETWFAPAIKVVWTDTSDAEVHTKVADAASSNDAKQLAEVLEGAQKAGKVAYVWDDTT